MLPILVGGFVFAYSSAYLHHTLPHLTLPPSLPLAAHTHHHQQSYYVCVHIHTYIHTRQNWTPKCKKRAMHRTSISRHTAYNVSPCDPSPLPEWHRGFSQRQQTQRTTTPLFNGQFRPTRSSPTTRQPGLLAVRRGRPGGEHKIRLAACLGAWPLPTCYYRTIMPSSDLRRPVVLQS